MVHTNPVDAKRRRGRGAAGNESGRFEALSVSAFDDGWESLGRLPAIKTTVTREFPKTIITRNASPDVPFDRSINPYRGCEHGCVYCYARPSHAWHGLSAGLDFESRLFAKPDAARLLARELARPGYRVAPIAMGTNTDPYQPIERRFAITRSILEVLLAHRHPLTIVTKSAGILRDLDLLSEMAARNLVQVGLSVTSLDHRLSRLMEPRAAAPKRRLEVVSQLTAAGVPSAVMVAPVIPAINDHQIDDILKEARAAGARQAHYILIRLPGEVAALFEQWLAEHFPDRRDHVLSLIRDMRGGQVNDPRFGKRMRGGGPYAHILARRFALAAKKLGLDRPGAPLATDLFRPPARDSRQLQLL